VNTGKIMMLCSTILLAHQVVAGDVGPISNDQFYSGTHFVLTIDGGAAWPQNVGAQTFYLAPGIIKTYDPTVSTDAMGIGEVFIGEQHAITTRIQGQLGLAFGITSNFHQSGDIWEDANPDFNNYLYQYAVDQKRIAVKGKLLTMPMNYQLSPYVAGSAGVGFNHLHGYSSTPKIEEESIQPPFGPHTTTSFTYTLGAGLQREINTHWGFGMGYEFSDLGKSWLSRAAGQSLNQGLGFSHLYTNGIIASLTYLG
jgi:opacity protein-like surface antigen